ncbi:ShlB/FhaC/HecB family hemolysin secretion/activation protein [Polynucleobacter arcticus]|nr:ShlB/FhaC/HecB family hemolysin secretion/activation protein [Polynucleobacter arcticus]
MKTYTLHVRMVSSIALACLGMGTTTLVSAQGSGTVGVSQAPAVLASTTPAKSPNPSQDARVVKAVSWDNSIDPQVNAMMEKAQASLLGQQLANAQITEQEAQLTKALRDQGYLIGQVVVSAADRAAFYQTGDLRLSIFLGKIGQIVVKNTSAVNSDWVQVVVDQNLCPNGVGNDCVLTKTNFERMTQLLYDTVGLQTGGLEFSSQGMPVGQTQLTVTTLSKEAQIKGAVGADNQGFSSTGQYRLATSLSANNLLGVGDVLGINLNVSNQGSVSGAIDLSGPLAANGLRWQGSVSRSQFSLPSYNNTSGFGNALSLGVAYPLLRGLDQNWTAGLNAVVVATSSETGGVSTANKTLQSGQLTVDGNSGDRSILLGQNTWFFRSALTVGQVMDDANSLSSPYYEAVGGYTKLAFQGVGKIILSDAHSIYSVINIRGQAANTNLDAYERMMIGGYSGLRAYSVEQGSINQGTISSLELRKAFNTEYGQFVPVIFADYLNGWVTHGPDIGWQAATGYSNLNLTNHIVASDAGIGLDWNYFNKYSLSASWAKRLPMSPAGTYGNGNSQFWFVAQVRF